MKPYVYKCTHKETGEFYIGYRCANKVSASEDFGIQYFTSSKFVKPRFNEFTYEIIAEFEDGSKAHATEQSLIMENWKNPKLLNKVVHTSNDTHYKIKKFGNDNPATRPEVKAKIKAARAAQVFSEESQLKKSATMMGHTKTIALCKYCGETGGSNGINRWHNDNCKYTPEVVAKIYKLISEGVSYLQISKLLNVSRGKVSDLDGKRGGIPDMVW